MGSFEELFTACFERVYRFCLKLTRRAELAEELTEQTFFKALKSLDSFNGRCEPGAWLISIAKNACFDSLRRRRELPLSALPRDDAAESPEWLYLRGEETMRLHRCLHALSEPCREVFMLRVFGKLKYAQIAALFHKSESWAKVTYYRARLELQNRLKEEEE